MTAPILQATFSDWRTVKSRKVMQLIFEVPIEQAEKTLQVLGFPNPADEKWVAVCLLDKKAITKVDKPKSYAQEAGKMCTDYEFKNFLAEFQGLDLELGDAAAIVRHYCGVKSRSQIIEGTSAANSWSDLMARFEIWRRK